MAKNNMTFNASIRLNSVQFKKGVADVQRSLKSLQSSFLSVAGALGLGLSFSKLGSSLLDTATKLSTAKNVLENVSKGFGEYGENLEWLKKISNEYGQDVITLINSFAQFRAAAESSNLSLEQMRDIYESLTRAAGAFHLSADRTNDMMMAVTQMMSKGKVAAEELRRQLGNVLPGAFNLMAQAAYNAGIITENSTAALEDAMKKGKVLADEVLPAFAKVLNDTTQGANFESLQSSMNRLKNSWTELVESANFEGVYKGIIDEANKVVKYFSEGFWSKLFSGLALAIGSTVVPKAFRNFMNSTRQMSAAAIADFNKIYEAADKVDDKIASIYSFKEYGGKGISKHRMKSTNPNLHGGISFLEINEKQLRNLGFTDSKIQELRKHTLEYNDSLIKLNQASKQAGAKPLFSAADERRIVKYNKHLSSTIKQTQDAGTAFGAFNKKISLSAAAVNKAGRALKALGAMLKTALASLATGAVIAGITYIASKLIEMRKETKRIDNIVHDMYKAVGTLEGQETDTITRLNVIKKSLEEFYNTLDDPSKQKVLDSLNKELGRTGNEMFTIASNIKTEVLPALNKYIDKLKEAAYQNAVFDQISSATSRVIKLELENQTIRTDPNYNKQVRAFRHGGVPGRPGTYEMEYTKEAKELSYRLGMNNKEIEKLQYGINHLMTFMADEDTKKRLLGVESPSTTGSTSGNTDSGGTGSKETPQAALNKYKEELKKLENQYAAGAILAEEYKKKVEELNQKSFEELSSFGWDEAMKGLKTSADKALAEELRKTATAKLLEGLDDPEAIAEFDKEMEEEAKKSLDRFKEAWDKYIEYAKKKPVLGKVDSSDWYMYSGKPGKGQTYSERETHFNSEYLNQYEKYVDDLESYKDDLKEALKNMTDPASIKRLNELLDQTIERLKNAKIEVKDLKTKANIAQIEKDIADLKKEGLDSVFSSITSVSDGMDRLYRAFQSIKQINEETWKIEELENFLTGLNAIIQAFEVIKSIIEAVTAVTKVYEKIKEKQAAKAIALNAAEAASETAKGSAAAGAAAAGAASSTASIPIVGPILAVAAVAAVTAAILAGMKKFATGGFVGGNSYSGDKNLVRVNSGEMILNPAQQRNLLALANGQGNPNGKGQVDFKIRGDQLVGVLQNYNRLHK